MQKHKKRNLFLVTLLSVAMLLCSCASSAEMQTMSNATKNANAEFDALTRELFIEEAKSDTLTLNFTLKDPSAYSIEMDSVTWGDVPVSSDDFKEYKAQTEDYLAQLNAITDISSDRALTYDIVKYYLEMDLESYDYVYFATNFAPLLGIQSQLPIILCEYNFDTQSDVEDYLTLLNTVEAYMTQLIEFENAKADAGYGMCRSALEAAISDCRSFCESVDNNMLIEVFPSKLEALDLTEEQKQTYIASNTDAVRNHVIPAYEMIISALTLQLDTAPENGSLASYENGQDYYAYLLKASVGTDKTPEELIELTESRLDSYIMAISFLYMKNEAIFDELEAVDFSMEDPTEIIEHFKDTLVKEQFPDAPDANYDLKTVHESMSDSLSPAMYFIPRIDDAENNQIYLNIGGNNSSNELMPTLAHEGYPGHMYQTTYFYNTNPDPIRTVFESNGYVEGWASYVEGLSYDYCGFSEDISDLLRIANHDLTLNLYCRTDLGIHYENWDISDASDFLTQYLDLDTQTIEEIYEAILYNPTNYLIYGIGMEEIKALKDTMQDNLGDDFDIKDFHEQLLNIGPAPFSIIGKYMPDAVKTTASAQKYAA